MPVLNDVSIEGRPVLQSQDMAGQYAEHTLNMKNSAAGDAKENSMKFDLPMFHIPVRIANSRHWDNPKNDVDKIYWDEFSKRILDANEEKYDRIAMLRFSGGKGEMDNSRNNENLEMSEDDDKEGKCIVIVARLIEPLRQARLLFLILSKLIFHTNNIIATCVK